MRIGEFFIDLVVDAAKGELTIKNLVTSMGALEVVSVGEIAVLQELAKKLAEIAAMSLASAMHLNEFNFATGASTKELERWSSAATHVGVSGDKVSDSMQGITKSLAGLKVTGSAGSLANLGQMLGIDLTKFDQTKPEKLLSSIRENKLFMARTVAEQGVVLASAGLEPLLRLLTKHRGGLSNAEFNKFAAEMGVTPQVDLETYHQTEHAFASIENASTRIKKVIGSWFSKDMLTTLNTLSFVLGKLAAFMDDRGKAPTLTNKIVRGAMFPHLIPGLLGEGLLHLGIPQAMAAMMEGKQNLMSLGPTRPEIIPYDTGARASGATVHQSNSLTVTQPNVTEGRIKQLWDEITAKETIKILAQTNVGPH